MFTKFSNKSARNFDFNSEYKHLQMNIQTNIIQLVMLYTYRYEAKNP